MFEKIEKMVNLVVGDIESGKMLGNLPIPGPGTVFKEHVG